MNTNDSYGSSSLKAQARTEFVSNDDSVVFHRFLELEKQKSQRTSDIVRILVIDFEKIFEVDGAFAGAGPRNRWLKKVIEVFFFQLRASDPHARCERKVKILLANASKEEALLAARRLRKVINAALMKHAPPFGDRCCIEIRLQVWDYKAKSAYESVISENCSKRESEDSTASDERKNLGQTNRLIGLCDLNYTSSMSYRIKRLMDFVGAFLGIIVFLPVMVAIALAIKVSSPGQVTFSQMRVGLNGMQFKFFKYRSMAQNADHTAHHDFVAKLINSEIIDSGNGKGSAYKMSNDKRITRVGKILRRTSLDELPQLFNVLKGEMSLVGPRPAIPYEVEKYAAWHLQRFAVFPGLTGLWQVRGRSRTTFDEMVRYDLEYIRTWSLWLETQIFLKTFKAVVVGSGAL